MAENFGRNELKVSFKNFEFVYGDVVNPCSFQMKNFIKEKMNLAFKIDSSNIKDMNDPKFCYFGDTEEIFNLSKIDPKTEENHKIDCNSLVDNWNLFLDHTDELSILNWFLFLKKTNHKKFNGIDDIIKKYK